MAILVLNRPWRAVVLSTVWGIGLVGIGLKLFRIEGFPRLTGGMYIGLGWMAVLVLPLFIKHMSAPAIALFFSGGVLYTGGAVVLARHRPDPIPSVFGYHEIWHSCVVAASACHYLMVLLLLLAAR
jgi:hemolysin III